MRVAEAGEIQEFQRAHYAILRRPDFVAHRGQEGGLGLARVDSVLLSLGQGAFDFLACADIGKRAQQHGLTTVAGRRESQGERPAAIAPDFLDSAGQGSSKHLRGLRGIVEDALQVLVRIQARVQVEPLLCQMVAEQRRTVRLAVNAQRHRRGFDKRAAECAGFRQPFVRPASRQYHAPVVPADEGQAAAQPE